MSKTATTDHPIHDLLRERWSPRAFTPTPIAREVLCSLLEAARWAPSCANEQPWAFVVASRAEEASFASLLDCLSGANPSWAKAAGALLLGVARTTFAHNGAPNRHAWYDLGQAVSALTLEATSRGLFVHQMAGFSAEKARENLSIPAGYEPVVALALGALGDPSTLSQVMREREEAPRQRKPQAEFVHWGGWGR